MEIWHEIAVTQAYNNLVYALNEYYRKPDAKNKSLVIGAGRQYRKVTNKKVVWIGKNAMLVDSIFGNKIINN